MKPRKRKPWFECGWETCEDTRRRVGVWTDLGPLTLVVRVPRRNPTSPGGVILMWGGDRILLDTFPRPKEPEQEQPGQ